MLRVDRGRLAEPGDFDARCRKPGNEWLAAHPAGQRPRDYWSPFKGRLADGFGELCAYAAMYEPVGTVDHFSLAYEWANYRYASAWINSSKNRTRAAEILDPLLVETGWFRILLPSLQLVTTERIPIAIRPLAESTLRRLHLGDDERVIRQRRAWYKLWQSGELTLVGLRQMAPLIAEAVSSSTPLP